MAPPTEFVEPTGPPTEADRKAYQRRWCFTSYQPTQPLYDESFMNYLVYGKEHCPTTGRMHWQGYVEVKKKIRMTAIVKLMPHISFKAARGSAAQNKTYCHKGGVELFEQGEPITPGQRTDLTALREAIAAGNSMADLLMDEALAPVLSHTMQYARAAVAAHKAVASAAALAAEYVDAELRPWQAHVVDIVKQTPDPRLIFWILGEKGNQGKSFLADYLSVHHNAITFEAGKCADIAFAYDEQPVVIFDLPRSSIQHVGHVYSLVESFKNGRIFSPKYESSVKRFAKPHVIVFSNFPPSPAGGISENRYCLITLLDHGLWTEKILQASSQPSAGASSSYSSQFDD